MIIDCIGCLHGHYPELEGGDLLIVTGDLTARDRPSEYDDFLNWMKDQKYEKKILIAGNHDNTFSTAESSFFEMIKLFGIDYLCDSGTQFEGLKIWGSPWSLSFPGINPKCTAFTGTEEEIAVHFAKIPSDTDILVTHSPPFGIRDGISIEDGSLFHAGSHSLLSRLEYLPIRLHVFSHIHEGYGIETRDRVLISDNKIESRINVNCAHMDAKYRPINGTIRVVL